MSNFQNTAQSAEARYNASLSTETLDRQEVTDPRELRIIQNNHTRQPSVDIPTRNSFQMGDDRIWGCEYPGAIDDRMAQAKIATALEFGITHFIDLTEEGELKPYAHLLPQEVQHLRFPIRDVSVPTSIQDTYQLMLQIEEMLKEPQTKIYLHCWGGVGRTGTIAACWIAYSRHTDYTATMQTLLRYWQQCPKSQYRAIPDTLSQELFIQTFINYLSVRH